MKQQMPLSMKLSIAGLIFFLIVLLISSLILFA